MIEQLKNLSQREQLMLGGLGVLVALLVLVYGVISPILSFEAGATRDYRDARRLSVITSDLEAPGVESADDRALRSVVTQMADRRQLKYTRVNQTADGQLQVDMEGAPYAAFFAWLQQLEDEADIVVSSAFVAPGETAATVEARVTLVRQEG
ncbi:hypothetical protein HK107_12305 [Parvularcula sp. ZS-1/3]|uniref:Type II secretion system protein M n=1 Tax=Parvularcula mediterranea TaxID=2732508 RepID=A0A7Y3RN56_9PROT|nr:type II secretion system protein GspM [Parvularcula mediterranea]NNU17104.1 hypothetical protein [Parvularcula mediterranea]